jgi:hypothetical protein
MDLKQYVFKSIFFVQSISELKGPLLSMDAIRMLFLQNHQRDTAEYGDGRQYQAQCQGLTEENDATQGRNDRDTELHCRSLHNQRGLG